MMGLYAPGRVPNWEEDEVEDDDADVAEAPAPTPGPTPRPKPTPKAVAKEDTEMSDAPRRGVATGKRPQVASDLEDDSITTDDPTLLGEKRALQDSPSRAESVAKRVRTSRRAGAGTSNKQGLDLGDLEVVEDAPVDLELIPGLVGKVRVYRS